MNVAALALTNLKNIIIAIPPKDSHGTRFTIPKRGGDGSKVPQAKLTIWSPICGIFLTKAPCVSDLATNVGNDHAKNLLRYWITRSLYQFIDLLVEHLGVLHPLVRLPNWPYHCQLKGVIQGFLCPTQLELNIEYIINSSILNLHRSIR